MSVPSFAPKPAVLIGCVVLFIASLVGAALVGSDPPWTRRLAHDAIQAVGAAALVVGGVGVWIESRRRKRWRELTQGIAIDLLDQSIRAIGAITSAVVHMQRGDDSLREQIDQLFHFPWSEKRAEEIRAATRSVSDSIMESLEGRASGAESLQRATELSPDVARRADSLRSAALELSHYVDEESVLRLVNAVIWVHRGVRDLTDEIPRRTSNADMQTLLRGPSVAQVIKDSLEVANCLAGPYVLLRKGLRDQRLAHELVLSEKVEEGALESDIELRKAHEWLEEWQRETDELVNGMAKDLEQLQMAVAEWRNS